MPNDSTMIPVRVGDAITIRVEATNFGGPQKTGVLDALDFKAITQSVEAIASAVADTFAKVAPHKAAVEFGIEVGWEAGNLVALLCQGSGKANLKVVVAASPM